MTPGVIWSPGGDRVRVWAPSLESVDLVTADGDLIRRLDPVERGWFVSNETGVAPGDRYLLRLDGGATRPDPASRLQPDGVHGPSEVVDLSFDWTDDAWSNPPLEDHVFYELHVGTFTPAGTFDGVAERIPHLVDLGITAIELMPVAQFPGARNWGYDGVDLFAVQQSYGGPRGLARLVDACHRAGLAVFLDVVYNHLGPEGNYLREFGPYFTDRYRTPWGEAVNLDGPGSDGVRSFFIENALMWIDDFHIDGLRLDAVHAIVDTSARPFLAELADAVHTRADSLGRSVHLVAESSANDPRLVRDRSAGGMGLDGAWNDDFHHALHVALTGEHARYYADFADAVPDLTKGLSDGYINDGRYSPYRGRRHGAPSTDLPRSSLVVFAQNHDQIGNRARGDRLSTLVDADRLRFAAAVTLLAPWVPLLYMGEEWAETQPFLYFVDHGDEDLVRAVGAGRAEEFAGFIDDGEEVPDPGSPRTFEESILDWEALGEPPHAEMLELHRRLIGLRRSHAGIGHPDPDAHTVSRSETAIVLESGTSRDRVVVAANAGASPVPAAIPEGSWKRLLDVSEATFGGPGTDTPESHGGGPIELRPWGVVVYQEVSR